MVAGGIDVIYPKENTGLYEQIRENGLIVAESPLSTEPIARHFPKRNRIISGLSAGVIIVEASFKSGSLITARLAGEQGRDVYAVPGHPFDPRAQGPNKLISDGAVLVQGANDVLQHLTGFTGGRTLQENQRPATLLEPTANLNEIRENDINDARDLILSSLSTMPVAVDELLRTCQLTIPVMQEVLLELELAGRLQRLPGNRVVLLN